MKEKRPLAERFKSDPISHLIALYAIFGSLLFFFIQTGKLFRPEAAEAEMLGSPLGRFDWGFVWADTFVPGPLLLVGGLCLLWGSHCFGQLLIFTGFAVNLYATIFLLIGFQALGKPLVGADLVFILVTAFLGLLGMIWLAMAIFRKRSVR